MRFFANNPKLEEYAAQVTLFRNNLDKEVFNNKEVEDFTTRMKLMYVKKNSLQNDDFVAAEKALIFYDRVYNVNNTTSTLN